MLYLKKKELKAKNNVDTGMHVGRAESKWVRGIVVSLNKRQKLLNGSCGRVRWSGW